MATLSNEDAASARYFVPSPSRWPIRSAIALLLFVAGAAVWLNRGGSGPYLLGIGLLLLALVLVGWFTDVSGEGRLYNGQVDRSIHWGMAWFILSEVMVFATLFAALFYLREISLPDFAAGGRSADLWPGFTGGWPATGPGLPNDVKAMPAKGVAAINTIMLLCSGAAITLAHGAAHRGRQAQLVAGLAVTLALGAAFLYNQAGEYRHAITEMNLTLSQGAYGSTFYFLTGLHGVHVTIGATMVAVMLVRALMRRITPRETLGFDMVAWYWHFVGIVWLLLYVVVYVL
jgi:cytochrome c oxidase subunit 3